MAVSTTTRSSRPHPRPRAHPRPHPVAPPTAGPDGPWVNAVEGAAAALSALVVMAVVAAVALSLVDAGSVGSLWSLTAAVIAMAVGGSVSAGSGSPGDAASMDPMAGLTGGAGGMTPSMTGAADLAPLGLTLIGSVVLWLVFSWGLRKRRPATEELAARAAGAAAAALFAFALVATLAHGTFTMPTSAMSGLGGGGGGGKGGADAGGGGGMGGAGGMGGGGMGGAGGGMSAPTSMTFDVNVGSAMLGVLVWVAVVLAVGCLISRRARLPLGGAVDRIRSRWTPGFSAVARTLVLVAAVPMVMVFFIGLVVGGRATMAAGAALLLAPNALAVFTTLGVGSPWTAGTHQVQSQGNPMAGMMGGMGGGMGGAGDGSQPAAQPDRMQQLREVSARGLPLWVVALAVTVLILLACAFKAARAATPAQTRPLHPYNGRLARHLGMAERFAVVTAVVLGAAAWLAGASGNFAMSMFGSQMGGTEAELSGSVLLTVVFGLVVGAATGFAGSLLAGAVPAKTKRPVGAKPSLAAKLGSVKVLGAKLSGARLSEPSSPR